MNDTQFVMLCGVMSLPELPADPDFNTNPNRVTHREELLERLQRRFSEETSAEWSRRLEGSGLAYGV